MISAATGSEAFLLDGGSGPHQSIVESSFSPNLATKGLVAGQGLDFFNTGP